MTVEPVPHIAALIADANADADRLLLDFARQLEQSGYRARGLVQQKCHAEAGCAVWLQDVDNGESYPISQRLGSHSTSCQIDTGGMAEASIVMRRISEDNTDLAIFNRFTGLEAKGEGFAQEMLNLMSQGIPVITIVSPRHLPAWRHFTGGLACELPAEASVLERWFAALQNERKAH